MDEIGEGMGRGARRGSPDGQSRHRHYTHGIGKATTRVPPDQHNGHISLLEEASGLANIHGQVYMKVNILSPGIL